MLKLTLIEQVKWMAQLAYMRDATRDSHGYTPGSDEANAFELEWDQCSVADIKLRAIRSTPMRARPAGGVQP